MWPRVALILVLVTTVALPACSSPGQATPAGQNDWSFELDATYDGKYVWRGINAVDDHVFQPSVSASKDGFTGSVWGNRDVTNVNGNVGDFTEIDYTLDYSWAYDPLTLSVGAIYYAFPNTGAPSTLELYSAVGLDTLLSPTLTVYGDVDEADGAYASLSVGHTFEDVWKPSDAVSLGVESSASVGYATSNFNSFYFGVDSSGFVDGALSVGCPLSLGEHWTVTPSLKYSFLIDDDLKSGVGNDDNLWAGLSLTFSF